MSSAPSKTIVKHKKRVLPKFSPGGCGENIEYDADSKYRQRFDDLEADDRVAVLTYHRCDKKGEQLAFPYPNYYAFEIGKLGDDVQTLLKEAYKSQRLAYVPETYDHPMPRMHDGSMRIEAGDIANLNMHFGDLGDAAEDFADAIGEDLDLDEETQAIIDMGDEEREANPELNEKLDDALTARRVELAEKYKQSLFEGEFDEWINGLMEDEPEFVSPNQPRTAKTVAMTIIALNY